MDDGCFELGHILGGDLLSKLLQDTFNGPAFFAWLYVGDALDSSGGHAQPDLIFKLLFVYFDDFDSTAEIVMGCLINHRDGVARSS